ncbi:MAG: DUF4294 domain-containing protein [Candidatus Symbiothrix sp.]|jgi:hypothetical protein|nr:DUF4294 domain-containing protein [Candidatus Symbiothrix sp.]
MKPIFIACLLVAVALFSFETEAQTAAFQDSIAPYLIQDGDTVRTLVLRDIYIYPSIARTSHSQDAQYQKLVRDVKKTLPYAKLIYNTLIETYEYMITLPDDKAREVHIKQMEDDLWVQYKPVLKKMTLSQGKLLIRLIDRECNQSSYYILKVYLGSFRAAFWNFFAGMFGASLKTEWDPDGKDAAAEKVCQMVEMGVI